MMFKDKYDESLKRINDEVYSLEKEKEIQEIVLKNELEWLNSIIKHGKIHELNREIAISLIDTVFIDESKQFTIVFKFKNEYETLQRVISNMGYFEQAKDNYLLGKKYIDSANLIR